MQMSVNQGLAQHLSMSQRGSDGAEGEDEVEVEVEVEVELALRRRRRRLLKGGVSRAACPAHVL